MKLETRFKAIRQMVEGFKEKNQFEHNYDATFEENNNIVPINYWHRRIISELDFCLQLQKYAEIDCSEYISEAMDILEECYAFESVLTDFSCEKAEKCLLPLQEVAKSYTLLMVGHAHLDMNWMWSWDETVATVVATFRTMLRLMNEYPQFCYSQSQASTYKLIEEYAPEMMDEIKARIREGRWEVTASNWVETDKNMPCLESLMNHIVYTKKYLKDHWDIDPASLDIDFSPDTFGHSAFLPEVDNLGGVKYYYHCRGFEDSDKILYRWKAPSGKELLMYKEPYWYNSSITPQPAIGLPKVAKMCGGLKTGMAVYGVGDHGGGPTRRDLERGLEMQEWPVFPELKFGTLHDYFAAAESVRDNIPVVEHELNCIFTGCYTTQSRIKKGNRRSELALNQAEGLSALASRELSLPYAESIFETAWQKTLFTHFHDILTGSCVQDTREHAMGLYQDVLSAANTRSALALEKLAESIDTSNIDYETYGYSRSEGAGVGFGLANGNIPTTEGGTGLNRILHIVNTTSSERYENARVTVWDWPGDMGLLDVTDVDGNSLPFEFVTGKDYYWAHNFFKLDVTVRVPSFGYTTIILKEKEPDEVTSTYLNTYIGDRHHDPIGDIVLENKYICARLDNRSGQLYSLIDKETGKERIRQGETCGLRYIQTQRDGRSAWMIGRYLTIKEMDSLVWINQYGNKLSTCVTTEHLIENSKVTTSISLGREDRYLKFDIHIDWHEHSVDTKHQPILSYYLPLKDTAGRMLCDVPGGVQWRPDQEMDVPCQRYGAPEFGDGRVLALASDCKYGFRLSRGDLFVTLINTANNPDSYPERGVQDVCLYLAPADSDAVGLAKITDTCLNPLQYVTNTAHKGALPTEDCLLKTEGESVIFSGVAQRDGSLSIRMYEAKGVDCPVSVTLHSDAKGAMVTDLFGNKLDIPVITDGCNIKLTLPAYSQAELRI